MGLEGREDLNVAREAEGERLSFRSGDASIRIPIRGSTPQGSP